MSRMRITKEYSFEAAHVLKLDGFDYGKCGEEFSICHGHSYLLNVSLFINDPAKDMAKNGMILNFTDLNKIVNEEFIDKLDHTFLNETFPEMMTKDQELYKKFFLNIPHITTCESMAYVIAIKLAKRIYCEKLSKSLEFQQQEIGNISSVGIELWEGRKGRSYYEFNLKELI